MAERLRQERDRRGHSQTAVAKAVGMKQSTLSNWESGVIPEQVEQLKGLARYYGVSVGDLIGDEEQQLSPAERTAAELIAAVPEEKRAAALAVFKATMDLATVHSENSQTVGARDGGGVTSPSSMESDLQSELRAEKDSVLAVLRAMLPAALGAELTALIDAGHVLTDADVNRFLQAARQQTFSQQLQPFDRADAVKDR